MQGLMESHRLKSVLLKGYRQPHEFGVQPQLPVVDASLEEAVPFEDFPALNTESCSV
jgi:hypothetical protein